MSSNKYFEDYEKVIHIDKTTGKRKTEYVYKGDYFVLDMTEDAIRSMKIRFTLYFIAYTLCFLVGSLLNSDCSRSWGGTISLLTVIPWIFAIGGLYNVLRAGGEMEKRRIRYGFTRLRSAMKVCMFFSAAEGIAGLIVMIVLRSSLENVAMDIVFLILAAGAAVVAHFFVRDQIKTVVLETIPQKKPAPVTPAPVAVEKEETR